MAATRSQVSQSHFLKLLLAIASGDLAGNTTYKFDQIRKIEQQPPNPGNWLSGPEIQ